MTGRPRSAAIAVCLAILACSPAFAEEVLPRPGAEGRFLDLIRRVSPLPGDLAADRGTPTPNVGSAGGLEDEYPVELLLGTPRRLYVGGGKGPNLTVVTPSLVVITPIPTSPGLPVRDDWRTVCEALQQKKAGEEQAEAALARIQKDPAARNDSRTHYLVGLARLQQGRNPAAEAAFRTAADLGEKDPLPLCFLGLIRLLERDPKGALAPLQAALERSPRNPTTHALLGEAYSRLGAWADAIRHLEPVVKAGATGTHWRLLLAMCLFRAGRDAPAAALLLSLEPTLRQRYQVQLLEVRILFSLGRVEEAVARIAAAAKLRPDAALPHLLAAHGLLNAGRTEEALAEVLGVLSSRPGNARALLLKGETELAMGRLEEAERSAAAAAAAAPDAVIATILRAKVSLARGRAEEGIAHLEKAARAAPGRLRVHRLLGDAYREAGRRTEAIAAYERFLTGNPKGSEAKRIREIVRSLR